MASIRVRFTGSAPEISPPDPGNDGEFLLPCATGQSLTQAIYLSGLFEPPALCSGIGRCGRCRMRIVEAASDSTPPGPEDERAFTAAELAAGWRLGCHHTALPGMALELPDDTILLEVVPQDAPHVPGVVAPKDIMLLAVDLGTTSLHWRFFTRTLDTPWPEPVCRQTRKANFCEGGLDSSVLPPESKKMPDAVSRQTGQAVNPQMGAGSDVISRLAQADRPGGAQRLQTLVLDALKRLVRQSVAAARPVAALCLAANPAMTCIALGRETASLAHAPYSLPLTGGEWTALPGLPPVWIPPQLSPFVGGDLSAGYAALALAGTYDTDHPPERDDLRLSPKFPFLLADLGTNGEFLLALSPNEALVASVPLGPALEGIGLPHGTEARPGAITGFSLTPQGLDPRFFDACAAPLEGISGSGYLSLLYCLLKAGALDREGHFSRSPLLERFFVRVSQDAGNTNSDQIADCASKKKPHQKTHLTEAFLPLGRGLRLYAGDVEELLKVKAAFSLGFSRLLEEANIAARDLSGIFLAGALGEHCEKEALETLGFFPPGITQRLHVVGNASLDGAALLLRSREARAALVRWARGVRAVNMTGQSFQRDYAAHMRFMW